MKEYEKKYQLEEILTQEEVEAKISELAEILDKEYKDQNPIIIGILNGAVYFLTSLTQKMKIDLEIDLMGLSSYRNSSVSSGKVQITKDISRDIEGRPVIIIEDIIDTGRTLQYLTNYFANQKAKSVETITLLEKDVEKVTSKRADRALFKVPDVFIVGYGLDYANKYRNLPGIFEIKNV